MTRQTRRPEMFHDSHEVECGWPTLRNLYLSAMSPEIGRDVLTVKLSKAPVFAKLRWQYSHTIIFHNTAPPTIVDDTFDPFG
jgi:hypothetical protein